MSTKGGRAQVEGLDSSASATDRRIRSILAHIAGSSGGEALAAMNALERLLPPSATLAEVLFVGLHHLRQDRVPLPLVQEINLLSDQLDEGRRREEGLTTRIADLEAGLRAVLKTLCEIRDRMGATAAGESNPPPAAPGRNKPPT